MTIDSPNREKISKYIFWTIIVILVVLSYFIIKQFIIPLASSFVLAYLVRPVFLSLNKKTGKNISAVLTVILTVLVIIIPIILVAGTIISQAQNSLTLTTEEKIVASINKIPFFSSNNLDLVKAKETSLTFIINILKSTVQQIPSLLISLLITFFSLYYILINWEYLVETLKKYIPFKDKTRVSDEISGVTKQIVYGYLLLAILEFIVAITGFYISGVKFYVLLASLIAIFAFIPGIGPAIVWIPLTIYSFMLGEYSTAIGVMITGLIISLFIETILFVRILGTKSNIHPLILLMGILGGVPLFGILGIIIGPLILVYTIKLIQEGIRQHS